MGADATARDAARDVARPGRPSHTRGVTLLDTLYAAYREHERCGDLDSGLDVDRVWMAYTCGR